MKFLGVFLLLCTGLLCAMCQGSVKEKARAIAEECKKEVGASDADVEAMLKHEPAASAEAKCLRACTMKNLGILNANGKFEKDIALNIIKAAAAGDAEKGKLADEIVATCAGIEVSDDHCEAAAEYLACMRKVTEEKGADFEL